MPGFIDAVEQRDFQCALCGHSGARSRRSFVLWLGSDLCGPWSCVPRTYVRRSDCLSFLAEKKARKPVHTENHLRAGDAVECSEKGTDWLAQSIAILGLPSDKLILSGCLTAYTTAGDELKTRRLVHNLRASVQ